MASDIEIAQKAKLERISKIALAKLGIPEEHLEPYGHYKAKVSLEYLDSLEPRPNAKLVLVTAMTPTPAGEGKTTTTVGLGDAPNHIGKKAMICLREPSLGPVFGMKGGAAGGGYAQVVPMEDINLHFTGDFNAIALANNLLGAMTVLLKDAIKPNLVQTLENNPAFIHGGPFANIAHGCNSVIATSAAMKLVDYVVTEAGFGADLGAEKFIDIKCRKSGLRPDAVVIVATIRALKYHGGVDLKEVNKENLGALEKGIANLERHVNNVRNHYGLPCVVSINHFNFDTPAEIELLRKKMAHHEAPVILARHWANGGKGAEEVARTVIKLIETTPTNFKFVYQENQPLWDKIKAVATKIYGPADITADSKAR